MSLHEHESIDGGRGRTARPDERAAYTAGLRALADYLDGHPDLPLPNSPQRLQYTADLDFPDKAAARREVLRIAAVLGVDPDDRGAHFDAELVFGGVSYYAVAIDAGLDRRRWP